MLLERRSRFHASRSNFWRNVVLAASGELVAPPPGVSAKQVTLSGSKRLVNEFEIDSRPGEGTREWPPEIEMTPEVQALVDRRWQEYGISLDTSAGNGRIRQSSGPLRRLIRR